MEKIHDSLVLLVKKGKTAYSWLKWICLGTKPIEYVNLPDWNQSQSLR